MFEINQLPYNQLAALGLSKQDVKDMPPLILNALLSGKKTPLLTFSDVSLGNGIGLQELTGRLSVERGADGTPELRVHTPLNKMPTTVQGVELNKTQIELLQSPSNPILPFSVIDNSGKERQYLVQYDKALNDLHVRPVEPAPDYINGYKLTEQQQELFKKGMNIETPEGNIRKDMNDPLGYKANFLVLGMVAILTGPLTLMAVVASYLAIQSFDTAAHLDKAAASRDNAIPPYRPAEGGPVLMDYMNKIEARLKELSAPPLVASLNSKELDQVNTLQNKIASGKQETGQELSDTKQITNKEQTAISLPSKGNDIAQGAAENIAIESSITPAKHVPAPMVQRAQLRV